VYRF
jgi:hypothetical protein